MTLYVLVSATMNLTQVVTLTIYTKGANNNYALAQTNMGDTGIVFLIVPTTGQSSVSWTFVCGMDFNLDSIDESSDKLGQRNENYLNYIQ